MRESKDWNWKCEAAFMLPVTFSSSFVCAVLVVRQDAVVATKSSRTMRRPNSLMMDSRFCMMFSIVLPGYSDWTSFRIGSQRLL